MRRPWIVLSGIVLVVAGTATLAPAKPTDRRDSTVRIVLKNRDYKVVDLPPAGPSHGDVRAGNADLYNAAESKLIGTFHLFCALTDPADQPGEDFEVTQCQYTFRLPDGDITTDGLTRRASLGDPAAADIQAITGGTRRYQHARGQARLLPSRGDERRIVLKFR